MADFKGGYAIIDLEGKSLSGTPTTIGGIYAALADAYRKDKPVFLTGLTGGNATFAQLVKLNGTSFKLPGIYGKDITVTSQDKATAEDAGGGAPLTFTVYSDNSSPAFFATFLFEPGMTFGDFIASDYNINDIFTIEEGGIVMFDEINLQTKSYDMITATDDILSKIGVGLIVSA